MSVSNADPDGPVARQRSGDEKRNTMAGDDFLARLVTILRDLQDTQREAFAAVAEQMTSTIAGGGLVHLFGSGHSVLPVMDTFPRYGSFVGFNPLTDPRLMWATVLSPAATLHPPSLDPSQRSPPRSLSHTTTPPPHRRGARGRGPRRAVHRRCHPGSREPGGSGGAAPRWAMTRIPRLGRHRRQPGSRHPVAASRPAIDGDGRAGCELSDLVAGHSPSRRSPGHGWRAARSARWPGQCSRKSAAAVSAVLQAGLAAPQNTLPPNASPPSP